MFKLGIYIIYMCILSFKTIEGNHIVGRTPDNSDGKKMNDFRICSSLFGAQPCSSEKKMLRQERPGRSLHSNIVEGQGPGYFSLGGGWCMLATSPTLLTKKKYF